MKLLITTVVDQSYMHFLPIFIYCCKNQYPEYQVKLFTKGDFTENVKHAIDLIPYSDYTILHNRFKGWKHYKYSPISWRFLIDKEEYKDFDYVYVTDIDMMILREKVELLHYHLNEMAVTGLDYSNSLRSAKHWKGEKSLSGLHFADRDFFEKTNEVMKIYRNKVKAGEVGMKREYDGNMLYRIVKESGLGICKKYPLVERHHGIHVGSFRIYGKQSKLKKRIDKDKCRKWLRLWEEYKFREICELCFENPVVEKQINLLNEFCRKRVGC